MCWLTSKFPMSKKISDVLGDQTGRKPLSASSLHSSDPDPAPNAPCLGSTSTHFPSIPSLLVLVVERAVVHQGSASSGTLVSWQNSFCAKQKTSSVAAMRTKT